jgi:hypothetical protein
MGHRAVAMATASPHLARPCPCAPVAVPGDRETARAVRQDQASLRSQDASKYAAPGVRISVP